MNDNREPQGGLKPGDVVSVRGVVTKTFDTPSRLADVALNNGCTQVRVGAEWLTFIERPAPPEPDWQPGDLAEDDHGNRFVFQVAPKVRPWLGLDGPSAGRWHARDEIPGPLHKLTVTREDEGQ